MNVPHQDYSASITWVSDWTNHLATNDGLTISSATVTSSDVRVTVGTATVTGTGTGVKFRVSQTGITIPTQVVCVVQVTLSNGDVDERDFPIKFRET